MIFVALGTHHQPFDRLVLAADRVAVELGARVLVQHGATRCPAPHVTQVEALAPGEFEALLREARVVVLHAGSSSFLQARGLGRVPIVVPRDPAHGEHVDDHQLRFARSLGRDEAVVVDPSGLVDAVRAHVEVRGPEVDRSAAFCARFGPLVDGLVRRRRP